MKLCIIGPYPPPYGGVSNHIFRLLPFLASENINYEVFNQYDHEYQVVGVHSTRGSYLWWLKFLFHRQQRLVHFHQYSWLHFVYFLVYSYVKNDNFVVSIHNENLLNLPNWSQQGAIFLLRFAKFRKLIVVSKSIESLLAKAGVKNILYLPAYVPPQKVQKVSAEPRVTTAFFNIWKIGNVDDIRKYGVDLLIELAAMFPLVQFECFVATGNNIHLLQELIKKSRLDNFIINVGENLVDHFSRADVFLRLNREDAYGISIQEAMDCNVPAIASNVCLRPVGAKLFLSGDIGDLIEKFRLVKGMSRHKLLHDKVDTKYHLELIELYKELLV